MKNWDLEAVKKAASRGLKVLATDGLPLEMKPLLSPAEVPKKNKYGNKRVEIDGIKFASILEGSRYVELKYMKQAGEIQSFEMQVRYRLEVNGIHIVDYIADFVVVYPDGHGEVEDTKGVETQKFILQKKLMLAIYGIKIILIKKQQHNAKSKKPRSTKKRAH